MGWSESNISLKCQRHMTFTPPHQQICIKFSIFANFFLTVHYTRNIHLLTAITKGGKCRENPCFIGLFFRAGILYPPPLSPLYFSVQPFVESCPWSSRIIPTVGLGEPELCRQETQTPSHRCLQMEILASAY